MCHLGNNQSETPRYVESLHCLWLMTMVCVVHGDLKHITSTKSFDISRVFFLIGPYFNNTYAHNTYTRQVCIVLNWRMSVSGKVRSIIIEAFMLCTAAGAQQVPPLLNNNCRKWIQLSNVKMSFVIKTIMLSHTEQVHLVSFLADSLHIKIFKHFSNLDKINAFNIWT